MYYNRGYKKWNHIYTPEDRAIAIADFILEGEGHSTEECAEAFGLGQTTIQKDIRLLGTMIDDYRFKNLNLKEKYTMVKSTLKKVTRRNASKSKVS